MSTVHKRKGCFFKWLQAADETADFVASQPARKNDPDCSIKGKVFLRLEDAVAL